MLSDIWVRLLACVVVGAVFRPPPLEFWPILAAMTWVVVKICEWGAW